MKQKDFHVVIIDDKSESCRRIADRLTGLRVQTGPDEVVVVSASKVHVTLERLSVESEAIKDKWTFTKETLSQLLAVAKQKADMVIVDYIYVNQAVAKHLKEKAKLQAVQESEIEQKALNPKMLRDWFLAHPRVGEGDRRLCLDNLFHCRGPVCLHTYTPEGLHVATGTMEQRRRMATLAFPNGEINVIDTRAELFNDEEFDWPGPSNYDAKYYPYQLGVLFGQIVEKEIIKSLVERRPDTRRAFLVHGKSEREKEAVARLLEHLGIEVVILHEQPNKGRSILKKFRDYSDVGFAVVLLTADDKGGLAEEREAALRPRARQNVVFELGFFVAKLGDDRVCCLCSDKVEIPSELTGVLHIPLDESGSWRLRLARELKEAGFAVDLNKAG